MEEIAQQFREELQELLDRYKNRLSVPRIMHVAQDTFHKTLSIRHHPELHSKTINFFQSTGYNKPDLQGEFKYIEYKPGDEPNAFSGPNPICSQGPDGTCATYKNGWNMCKGCAMYHGGK